ncbi:MAG: hypothetical protein HKN76_20415 [Saprospiraceae bacterium]|nr:hypothetical protein [Saprospiraceae bacterium]
MSVIRVSLSKKEPVFKLPDSWPIEDLKALLKVMDLDLDAVNELQEVEEMCYMALNELETHEAASIVLTFLLGNDLEPGQISNMSHEMIDQKMWEEYPEISLHKKLYSANYLLYKAFNGRFPRPGAERVILKLENIQDESEKAKLLGNDKEICLKLLLGAFEENALIYRLYSEQISKGDLKEASLFIWEQNFTTEGTVSMLELTASTYWFDDLLDHAEYDAKLLNHETHV